MRADIAAKLRKIGITAWLLVLGGLGLLFVVLAEAPHVASVGWYATSLVVVSELGKALIVAACLGLTVDWALKQELISDAVGAALGYLLPSELRPEMQWIYNLGWMSNQYTVHLRLQHLPESGLVILQSTSNRTIENISGSKQEFTYSGGIDEWFHGEQSQILSCGVKYKDRRVQANSSPSEDGIGFSADTLEVEHGDEFEAWVSYTETKRDNDVLVLASSLATKTTLVTLEYPPTLTVRVIFDHRSKYNKENAMLDPNTYRLNELLLPHQGIRVKWHRTDQLEDRRSRIKPPR